MMIKNISDLTSPSGKSDIYYLMQDQPRKMTVIGVRGLYQTELDKALKTKNDYINLKPSYEWVDNKQTKTKLNGTCALLVTNDYDNDFDYDTLLSMINNTKMYGDCGSVGILVSSVYTAGEDTNEAIMTDARLIAAITL